MGLQILPCLLRGPPSDVFHCNDLSGCKMSAVDDQRRAREEATKAMQEIWQQTLLIRRSIIDTRQRISASRVILDKASLAAKYLRPR